MDLPRLLQSKIPPTAREVVALPGQANIVPSSEREAVCIGGVMSRVPCHMAAVQKTCSLGIGNGQAMARAQR